MHQIMPWSQKNVQNDHGIFQRLFFFIKKVQHDHGKFQRHIQKKSKCPWKFRTSCLDKLKMTM